MGFSLQRLVGGAIGLAAKGQVGLALAGGRKILFAGLRKGIRRPGDRGLERVGRKLLPEVGSYPGPAAAQVPAAGCPVGFRLNKSAYVTRGGGTSRWPKQLVLHAKGTECVRRRKLNAGNGRAATRSVRRLVSFYRLSNRVARQLRRAAAGAKLGRGRGQRRLPAGTGSVQVIDTD